MSDAVADRAVMARHARTFSAAARFLPASTRDAIASIYVFCRTVDDLADDHADAEALARVADELAGSAPPSALTAPLLALAETHGLPLDAAAHLVDGVRSDLGQVRIPTPAALVRYGYFVAGTVGRLVCPVLGVDDPRAVPFAVDLGVAMQLSNIARDVGEDAARDRVYLPTAWLTEEGLSAEEVVVARRDPDVDDRIARVVGRVLALADTYYTSADQGLRYLPLRPRVAVALAARRYRAIGHRVRSRGAEALHDRTVLGPVARARFLLGAPFTALTAGLWREAAHERELHTPLAALLGGAT